jgi:hypothetical protein
MVVASVTAGTKDSRGGGVRTDNQLASAGSASTRDPPVQVKTCPSHGADVLDITLVLRHAGDFDHDVVCGLLSKCLQDGSSDALVLHTFIVCYLVLNSRLFLR